MPLSQGSRGRLRAPPSPCRAPKPLEPSARRLQQESDGLKTPRWPLFGSPAVIAHRPQTRGFASPNRQRSEGRVRPLRIHILAGRLAGTVSRTLPFRRRIPDVQVQGLRLGRVSLRPLPLPPSPGLRLLAGYRPAKRLSILREEASLAQSGWLFFRFSLPQPAKLCQAREPSLTYFNVPFRLLLHDVNVDEAPARIRPGNPNRSTAPCAVA